jgi:hypothetical protein
MEPFGQFPRAFPANDHRESPQQGNSQQQCTDLAKDAQCQNQILDELQKQESKAWEAFQKAVGLIHGTAESQSMGGLRSSQKPVSGLDQRKALPPLTT